MGLNYQTCDVRRKRVKWSVTNTLVVKFHGMDGAQQKYIFSVAENQENIWAVFKTSIKTEWKLFILARNPCAILARPQWELARGQFFKLSLRDLARRWIPEIWCIFACAMQARSWFRTWVSWLLRFSARSVVSHSKSIASIQNLVCLNWLYLCKPEGRHTKQTMQQGSNGTRHPSRLVPLCCVTLFVVYSFIEVSIIYAISGLREAWAYMSLREACEKLARVWHHSIFQRINSTEY